jgi:uncharacterized protein (DUF39 family)
MCGKIKMVRTDFISLGGCICTPDGLYIASPLGSVMEISEEKMLEHSGSAKKEMVEEVLEFLRAKEKDI